MRRNLIVLPISLLFSLLADPMRWPALSVWPECAATEVLFEGYYRIEANNKHVGFSVQRLEYDAATQTQTLRYYISTTDRDYASRKIRAQSKQTPTFAPLSFLYELDKDGKNVKQEGTFNGSSFKGVFTSRDGSSGKIRQLSPGTFLSSAVNWVLAGNKPERGKVYSYQAIRESNGRVDRGQVQVLNIKTLHGKKIYQLLDDFENAALETWVLESGEILRAKVPDKNVISLLVKAPEDATTAVDVDRADLARWFGAIPQGKINPVAASDMGPSDDFFPPVRDTKYEPARKSRPLRLPAGLPRVSK